MVMLSRASRRSDECSGPFEGLGDDGGDQGEVVMLPIQFVVAPDYGRFHPASLPPATNGTLMVASGTLIGELRNGSATMAIRSPFRGQVDAWMVWAGQIVIPGQPLCSLRLPPGPAGGL